MGLVTVPYPEQVKVWPTEARHILAQYDDDTIIVYQAYRPSIGRYAAEHGAFGGDFSYSLSAGGPLDDGVTVVDPAIRGLRRGS